MQTKMKMKWRLGAFYHGHLSFETFFFKWLDIECSSVMVVMFTNIWVNNNPSPNPFSKYKPWKSGCHQQRPKPWHQEYSCSRYHCQDYIQNYREWQSDDNMLIRLIVDLRDCHGLSSCMAVSMSARISRTERWGEWINYWFRQELISKSLIISSIVTR